MTNPLTSKVSAGMRSPGPTRPRHGAEPKVGPWTESEIKSPEAGDFHHDAGDFAGEDI